MKDPRECGNWLEWSRLPDDEQSGAETPEKYRNRVLRTLYADTCARLDAKDAEVAALYAELDWSIKALKELVSIVRGECPSLLDEDSGGSAALALKIDDVLDAAQQRGGV